MQVSNADLLLFQSDTAMSNAALFETRIPHGRTELVRLLSGQPLAESSASSRLIHESARAIGPSRVTYPWDSVSSPTDINQLAFAAPANVDIPPRALRAALLVTTSDAGAPRNLDSGTKCNVHLPSTNGAPRTVPLPRKDSCMAMQTCASPFAFDLHCL